jgi:hypothetical protein
MRSRSDPAVGVEPGGVPLHGASPPVQHRLADGGALRDGAVNPAFEQRRGRAVIVLEEQRFAERHQEIHMVARLQVRHPDGAERHTGRRQVVGIGALAVALEVRAGQDHGGGVERGRRLLRGRRGRDGGVELPLVIGLAGPGQLGPLSGRRAADADHQGHREHRDSNRHFQGHIKHRDLVIFQGRRRRRTLVFFPRAADGAELLVSLPSMP